MTLPSRIADRSRRMPFLRSAAKAAASAHIKMKMIVMRRIIIGAQHSLKLAAGGFANTPEEICILSVALPARQHCNAPSIGQHKARHINGIGKSVFRKAGGGNAAHRAAGIAAHCVNAHKALAINIAGGLLHRPAHPGRKIAGQGALCGAQACNAGPCPGQQDGIDGRTSPRPAIIG